MYFFTKAEEMISIMKLGYVRLQDSGIEQPK